MNDDGDFDETFEHCWVRVRSTFVEVFQKKREPVRGKSAPVSLRRSAHLSPAIKVGLFSKDVRQSPQSTLLARNDLQPCQQDVTLDGCTVALDISTGKTKPVKNDFSHNAGQGFDCAEDFLTFMVCDLPGKVGEKRMMIQLKAMGFDGCYDYLYFPKRKRNWQGGEGYCFINFMSSEVALRFKAGFNGYCFGDTNSTKRARVELAEIQGRQANISVFTSKTQRPKYITDVNGIRLDNIDAQGMRNAQSTPSMKICQETENGIRLNNTCLQGTRNAQSTPAMERCQQTETCFSPLRWTG
eukprot:TRINITY_DN75651_c0_g1_i1.p1 TRINITY_DN75651_c0_g1~~TRINITY_DN75651_c0_g1_i1.p1  ORF type:complete len:298 (+),score=33.72 TRINITY_DN75651_c0_g1_i1:54-947(+)